MKAFVLQVNLEKYINSTLVYLDSLSEDFTGWQNDMTQHFCKVSVNMLKEAR